MSLAYWFYDDNVALIQTTIYNYETYMYVYLSTGTGSSISPNPRPLFYAYIPTS